MNQHCLIYENFDRLLESAARAILTTVGVTRLRYVERQLANQGYDFWWEGRLNGIRYRVRGDSWYPEKLRQTITVILTGESAEARVQILSDAAQNNGWSMRAK